MVSQVAVGCSARLVGTSNSFASERASDANLRQAQRKHVAGVALKEGDCCLAQSITKLWELEAGFGGELEAAR